MPSLPTMITSSIPPAEDAGTGASEEHTARQTQIPSLKSEFFAVREKYNKRKQHGIQILHQDELSLLEDRKKMKKFERLVKQVIHPNNFWRRTFDMFTVVFVVYLLYKIPFDVAFSWHDDSDFEIYVGKVLDWWFAIDILLNFKTGYIKNGTAVMHQKKVLNHYLSGWFIIDLLGTVPFKYMVDSEDATSGKSIKLSKFFKIPKLMRISRVLKYLRDNRQVYDIFKMFVIVLLSVHIGACVWVLSLNPCPTAEGDDGVILEIEDACMSFRAYDMYLEALITACTLMLGISGPHADLSDGTASALVTHSNRRSVQQTSICFMLYGLFLIATLIAEMNVYVMGKTQGSSAFQRKIDRVRHEMDYYAVPHELESQVRAYYDYIWVNQKQYDDEIGLLSDSQMSSDLQRKLALHLFMDTVKHISFFADVDDTVMGEICLSLKTLIFLPEDMILFKGDVGRELFIVAKGVVEVVRDDLPEVKRKKATPILLRSGSFFGEIALIMEVRRTCSVQAKTVCEINILLQRTFDDILREHPDFAKRMNELVVARQLETSLARTDGEGSMKIRQADLNYANKRVEATMMSGLRLRASGAGPILRKGSVNAKVFPGGRGLIDPSADPDCSRERTVSIDVPSMEIASGDSGFLSNSIASGIAKVKSTVGISPKSSSAYVQSQSEHSSSSAEAQADRRESEKGHAYYGNVPAINMVAPSKRENSMANIFDDLERRKSVAANEEGSPGALAIPLHTTGRKEEEEESSTMSPDSARKKTLDVMGGFNGSAVNLGMVRGPILMGGGDGGHLDSEEEDSVSSRRENDPVGRVMRKTGEKGFEGAKRKKAENEIKQIHQRMSRTEKMLEAMMSKLGVDLGEEGGAAALADS